MLNIGDVFSVVASLTGLFLTTTTIILGLGLFFRETTEAAATRIDAERSRPFWIGMLVGVPAFVLSIALSSAANPLAKFAGIMLMMWLLSITLLGAAAIAEVVSRRIRTLDQSSSPFATFSKGAVILVGSMLFPIVGWIFILPMVLIIGFGAATQTLFASRRRTPVVSEVS